MAHTELKMNEKTVIISGPINQLVQALATSLTSLGADVALIDKNANQWQRFASNLMDLREIHHSYGRVAVLEYDIESDTHAKESVSRAAELFGSIDVYIDALFASGTQPFIETGSMASVDHTYKTHLRTSLLMTHAVLEFLRGRKRGRIIYMLNEALSMGLENEALNAACRGGLIPFTKSLAREVREYNINVNCVGLGVTEEFLINRYPKGMSIKEALAEFQKIVPHAKMVDAIDVALTVAFLSSPLSGAITGQTLHVTHGLAL